MSENENRDVVWSCPELSPDAIADLKGQVDLPDCLLHVLAERGFQDIDSIEKMLNPRLSQVLDPFQLPGMAAAVTRLWQAIDQKERITVFGDYDVDGITSTTLLVRVFSALGGSVSFFLPDRHTEGYGLTIAALERCMDETLPDVLVTVDCGTNSVDAVKLAKQEGIDVVVTDHHEPDERTAPALALVNPKCSEATRDQMLAGVGVAFKVCYAMLKVGREQKRDILSSVDLRDYLDIVAIGTIADMVPLRSENRIFAKHGLQRLEQTGWAGLRSLISLAGMQTPYSAYHVGFVIGPRLNAAGRLGTALTSLALMLTNDPKQAELLSKELDTANLERRQIESVMLKEAREDVDVRLETETLFGIVCGHPEWNVGVVGLVASRISRRFHRPCAAVAFDDTGLGRGSCRSIPGFNLIDALKSCEDLLETCGGHKMAAGLTVKKENYEAFQKRFESYCEQQLKDADLRPILKIDGWLSFGDVEDTLCDALERLKPFGEGHAEPVWGIKAVSVVGEPRVVGERHLKIVIGGGGSQWNCIAFNMAERHIPEGLLDVAVQVQKNVYRGYESLQLKLQDFRVAE